MKFSALFTSFVLLVPLFAGEALGQGNRNKGGNRGGGGNQGKGATGASSSVAAASSTVATSAAAASSSGAVLADAGNNNNGDPQTSLSAYYSALPQRWRRF